MATYHYCGYRGIGYKYDGWITDDPFESEVFENAIMANNYYDDKVKEMQQLAAMNGCAIILMLGRMDNPTAEPEIQRYKAYEGENVNGWYAAIINEGVSTASRYIEQVTKDVGYYAFLSNKYQYIKPIAVASTLEELKELLGTDFDMYELHL